MIENARRGGHRVRVEMELEQEKYNGCSEEQRWCRDGETETLSKSNTSLELLEESIYYLCDKPWVWESSTVYGRYYKSIKNGTRRGCGKWEKKKR